MKKVLFHHLKLLFLYCILLFGRFYRRKTCLLKSAELAKLGVGPGPSFFSQIILILSRKRLSLDYLTNSNFYSVMSSSVRIHFPKLCIILFLFENCLKICVVLFFHRCWFESCFYRQYTAFNIFSHQITCWHSWWGIVIMHIIRNYENETKQCLQFIIFVALTYVTNDESFSL